MAVLDIVEFFFTKIPYAQLNQSGDLWNFLERIIHDARMTKVEIFV